MMSSNSSSTDPAEEFPEVDDYSEVDDLDTIAAELAAELRSGNGHAPEAPVEPVAVDQGDGDASSPEELAAALAQQVGIDLSGDAPIATGPVDLVEQGLSEDGGGQPVGARAGWFPPSAERGDNPGREVAEAVDHGVDHGEQLTFSGTDSADPASGGAPRPGPETLERPPSSPPIERAPSPPEPPVAPQPPRADGGDDAKVGHPVDQVAVRKLGGFNFLSVGQWATLPRDERARLLKGNLVMFLFEGDEVPVRPALVWFQQIARSESAGPDDPSIRRRGR